MAVPKKWFVLNYLSLTPSVPFGRLREAVLENPPAHPGFPGADAGHAGRERAVMTKSELIARIGQLNPHLYQRDVERIVSTIFDEITAALARGDRVELRGFGAFSVKQRDARIGRNPRTGESVEVDSKVIPFFKTGKQLRERLNGGTGEGIEDDFDDGADDD